jgi:hypothetical protein
MVTLSRIYSSTLIDLIQAPKTPINPQKQATILAWFHKTALAYSIKDLEKLIPSVASINGMAVKDYLQSLQDDELISSEKIGSGNWYWSFPSEAKKIKEKSLAKAQGDFDRANATAAELQMKVDQAGDARTEDAELLKTTGVSHSMYVNAPTDISRC